MNILRKPRIALYLGLLFLLAGCNYPGYRTTAPVDVPSPEVSETVVVILPGVTPQPGEATVPVQNTAVMPTAAPSSQPPSDLKRNGPEVTATRLEKSPVIDGALDDWGTAKNDVHSVVFGAENWSGEADLSGWFMLGWDDSYLYIGAQVTDDRYVQNDKGSKLYRGDSLELLFDSNLAGDFYVNNMSPDDFQLGISPGNPEPGQNMEAYLWSPTQVAGEREQVIASAIKTDSGYQVEAAIPWHVFESKPAAGNTYGFVFSISDNDNPNENVQQSMASNDPGRVLTDPTSWVTLRLTSQ